MIIRVQYFLGQLMQFSWVSTWLYISWVRQPAHVYFHMDSQDTLQSIMLFLYSHRKHKNKGSVVPHAHQHLVVSAFFILAILLSTEVIWL